MLTPLVRPLVQTPSRPRTQRSAPILPEPVRENLLEQLARSTGQAIEGIGLVLDTPGAIFRGALAGDPLSGFSFDTDRRVTGSELLESYGIQPSNPWAKTALGLATEIALDPLLFANLGAGAVSKAGRVASAAGLLDNAPAAAVAKMGTAQALKTQTGKTVANRLQAANVPLTPSTFSVTPLLGPRMSRSMTTLDDAINAATDVNAARQAAVNAAGGMAEYNLLRDETLGGALRLGVGDFSVTFNPSWAQPLLDGLDSFGASMRLSAPAVALSRAFDKRVGGQATLADQISTLRRQQIMDGYMTEAREAISKHSYIASKMVLNDTAKRLLGADSLQSVPGNALLKRYAEGKPSANDLQIIAQTPELKNWKASWHQIRTDLLKKKFDAGLQAEPLVDEYGVEWLGRQADEADFGPAARSATTREFTVGDNSDFARKLRTPGGVDDINEITLLPEIVQFAKGVNAGVRRGPSEEDMINVLVKYFDKKYGMTYIPQQDAWRVGNFRGPRTLMTKRRLKQLVRFASRRKPGLPDDIPLFSASPLVTQPRAMLSAARARANSEFVMETLAESAIPEISSAVPGGGTKSLEQALDTLTKSLGFAKQKTPQGLAPARRVETLLKQRLLARLQPGNPGLSINDIDLSQFSISESVINRLNKAASVTSEPSTQSDLLRWLDSYTNLFKNVVLARPARFVRDFYSNAMSVFFEVGNGVRVGEGFWNASKIVGGDTDSALSFLRSIPRYSQLGSDDLVKQTFAADVSANGVLSGLASTDLLKQNMAGSLAEFVPGATPRSVGRSLSNLGGLVPGNGRTAGDVLSDFATIRGVGNAETTLNPIFKASEEMGDTVDSVGRLGGFLALLKQGVAPDEAAKRIKRSMVDYSSLTKFERDVMRRIFPWWAYNSRIGKYVVENIMANPGGRYAQTIRSLNTVQRPDDDAYVPTALRQRFAVRLPDEITEFAANIFGVENDENVQTFLTDFDVPGVDALNIIAPGTSLASPVNVQGTLRNLLLQASPLLRGVGELATQTDTFTGRPLRDADTTANRAYRYFTGRTDSLNPLLKVAAGNFPPLQFFEPFLRPAVDTRIPPEQRALKFLTNYLTGVKLQDVDEDYILQDAQRKLNEILDPYNYTFSKSFVPEDRLPYLSGEELLYYYLSKDLDRDARLRMRQQRQDNKYAGR